MAGASTTVYEFDNVVEGSTFIKVYGLHSVIGVVKLISAYRCGKTTNVINML